MPELSVATSFGVGPTVVWSPLHGEHRRPHSTPAPFLLLHYPHTKILSVTRSLACLPARILCRRPPPSAGSEEGWWAVSGRLAFPSFAFVVASRRFFCGGSELPQPVRCTFAFLWCEGCDLAFGFNWMLWIFWLLSRQCFGLLVCSPREGCEAKETFILKLFITFPTKNWLIFVQLCRDLIPFPALFFIISSVIMMKVSSMNVSFFKKIKRCFCSLSRELCFASGCWRFFHDFLLSRCFSWKSLF